MTDAVKLGYDIESKQRTIDVGGWEDTTEGVLSPLPEGRFWVSEVILKPRVKFASFQEVKPSAIAHFHELALRDCFIAQSVKTKVTVDQPKI